MIILDWNVEQCARWLCDEDLEPLTYEGCRHLCNALWHTGRKAPYAPHGINSVWSVWARMGRRNWVYLRQLVVAIGREYKYRFGVDLRPTLVAERLRVPKLGRGRFIIPPLTVPERYWWASVPHSYKLWYYHEFKYKHKWTRREDPWWIPVEFQREERFECEVSHPESRNVQYAVAVGWGTPWGPSRRVPYSAQKLARWEKKMWKKKAEIREALRGQDLACFCDGFCFGKILLEIANSTT